MKCYLWCIVGNRKKNEENNDSRILTMKLPWTSLWNCWSQMNLTLWFLFFVSASYTNGILQQSCTDVEEEHLCFQFVECPFFNVQCYAVHVHKALRWRFYFLYLFSSNWYEGSISCDLRYLCFVFFNRALLWNWWQFSEKSFRQLWWYWFRYIKSNHLYSHFLCSSHQPCRKTCWNVSSTYFGYVKASHRNLSSCYFPCICLYSLTALGMDVLACWRTKMFSEIFECLIQMFIFSHSVLLPFSSFIVFP